MEQQMALSDTRGLTAGAREGAQQTLSATQQVALNQIESQTQSQLLELQQQGVQDEFLALEYASRKAEQFKSTSPEYASMEILQNNINFALQTGDLEGAKNLNDQLTVAKAQWSGADLQILETMANASAPIPQVRASTEKLIETLVSEPSNWDKFLGGVLIAGGVTVLVAGAIFAPFTGGGSLIGVKAGAAMIAGGAVAAGIGAQVTANEFLQSMSPEQKKERMDKLLAEDREILINYGYTAEQADKAIADAKVKLPPLYQN
jgi:hypothetical protein